MLDRDALRAAATAAQAVDPGAWRLIAAGTPWAYYVDTRDGINILAGADDLAIATYLVAAQPATVLALLDRIAALEDALRPLVDRPIDWVCPEPIPALLDAGDVRRARALLEDAPIDKPAP